jgi:hypothetical protein
MSSGESSPAGGAQAEQEPTRPELGLDQLSVQRLSRLGHFITGYAAHLGDQFRDELRETMLAPPDHRHVTMEEVIADVNLREFACDAIASYAERNPKDGFPLWRQLLEDPRDEVYNLAGDALIKALGVLDLDPNGVAPVIDAFLDGEDRRWEWPRSGGQAAAPDSPG